MTEALATKTAGQSLVATMANKYGIEPEKFIGTLKSTIFPGGQATNEQVAAFLIVANEYELNPFVKEIYAFPAKGGITPIISIDGWLTLINRQPMLNGIEFEDHRSDQGELYAITAKIFRKDRALPVTLTEYMGECRKETEPWKKWPARMLRHKALIQCARYAFGLSGVYDPDEAERIAESEDARDPIKQLASKTAENASNLQKRLSPMPDPPQRIIEIEMVEAEEPITDPVATEEDAEAAAIQGEAVEPDRDDTAYQIELLDKVKARLKKFSKDYRLEVLNGRDPEKMDIETLAAFDAELAQLV